MYQVNQEAKIVEILESKPERINSLLGSTPHLVSNELITKYAAFITDFAPLYDVNLWDRVYPELPVETRVEFFKSNPPEVLAVHACFTFREKNGLVLASIAENGHWYALDAVITSHEKEAPLWLRKKAYQRMMTILAEESPDVEQPLDEEVAKQTVISQLANIAENPDDIRLMFRHLRASRASASYIEPVLANTSCPKDVFEALIGDQDFEWRMINTSHCPLDIVYAILERSASTSPFVLTQVLRRRGEVDLFKIVEYVFRYGESFGYLLLNEEVGPASHEEMVLIGNAVWHVMKQVREQLDLDIEVPDTYVCEAIAPGSGGVIVYQGLVAYAKQHLANWWKPNLGAFTDTYVFDGDE